MKSQDLITPPWISWIFITLTFVVCFLPVKTVAQNNPKLAFALSGGGSKGIAQVGTIKVLEEAGIRPDLITGTSIGSILGGLYAIGYSIEDLEKLALELDWQYYFNDELERVHFPIEERLASDRYQLKFPFKEGSIALPTGFVKGQKISLLLSRLTIPAHGITDFDDFDIPFRAIATDFETGQAVVYGSGDLADALRASMSIPSVFEPCEIDEKLLIDGGVARNLPVQDALDLGADQVIAIDIGAPLYKKDELSSILDILEQTGSYKMADSNKQQTELADLVIRPQIEDISGLSFDQNDTLMARGQKAAIKMLPEIRQLVKTPIDQKPRGVTIPKVVNVVAFEVEGCDEKQVKTVKNLLQIRTPKKYKLDDIENRLKKLYGSGLIKLVKYRLLEVEEGYRLIVDVATQKGELIQIGANYDANYKAALLLNLTLRNRIFTGSKLSLDLKLSENPSFYFDYFAYTSGRPNIGWHIGSKVNIYPGFSYVDGKKEDQFRMRHYNLHGNISSALNNQFLISTGLGLERYVRSEEFFDPEEDDLRLDQYYFQLNFTRDTYDRLHFPTEGSQLKFEGKYSFGRELELLESDTTSAINSTNAMLRLQGTKVFPISKRVIPVVTLDGGYTKNVENNFLHRFYLGRALPDEVTHTEFMGLRYMEQPVSAYAMGAFKLQIETLPKIFTSPVFNYAYYQLKTQDISSGTMSEEIKTEEGSIFGAGLELGWLTILGPAIFTAEYNFDNKKMNFSLHIGYYF